ncbi:MAG: ABC transporter permease [Candidatus Geothermincolia bacterium]
MRSAWFWIRWSARELARRWVQVAVIALVIAIGTGVYAGLSSTSAWRQVSYDESFKALAVHDLKITLTEGSYLSEGLMTSALESAERPERFAAVAERLILPTQIDASTESETILVPGRLTGMPVEGAVDTLHVDAGRGLADDGRAVLEANFANQYDLPPEGDIMLAGGLPLSYQGTAFAPEYLIVTSGEGDFLSQANFAAVFLPLPTAQALSGHTGQVNDMVLRLAEGESRDEALQAAAAALSSNLPGVGFEIITIEEEPAYRLLYRDLDADSGTMVALAIIVLLAAAFAAFSLISRIVEAQRREIGIGMAMGVRRPKLALRPLLMGAEIAALGVMFGIGVGFILAGLMRSLFAEVLPLPVWKTPFQIAPFAGAAALGFLLPFAATAWPVWRAVRVQPVQAIRTGHLAARGGGMAPLLKHLRLPGGSMAQMPLRNVLRAPRRNILTALGIAASIISMVGVLGSLDTFQSALDRTAVALNTGVRDRVIVKLAGFQPADSELSRAIAGIPEVTEVEETLVMGGALIAAGPPLEVQLQALDMESDIWHPTVGSLAEPGDLPGLVLATKAARDLSLEPGDTFTLRHPVRTGPASFTTADTQVRLSGVHDNPLRFLAYTDRSNLGVLGMEGLTNRLHLRPAEGHSAAALERSLFELPGIAGIGHPTETIETTKTLIETFTGIFRIVAGFSLLLAALIAFNAASISADERRREHATMAAYGIRVRTLLRVSMIESGVIGAFGTLGGLGLGYLVLEWILDRAASTIPELDMAVTLYPSTIGITFMLGVVVVALAPLLTARRLRRMDVPSTLRVME